jgi:hypothetical protein
MPGCSHRTGRLSWFWWKLVTIGFCVLLVWGLVDQGLGSLWLTVPLLVFAVLRSSEPDEGYGHRVEGE